MWLIVLACQQLASFLVYFFLCTRGEVEGRLSNSCTFMASVAFVLLMIFQCRSLSLHMWRLSFTTLHKQIAAFILGWCLFHGVVCMVLSTKSGIAFVHPTTLTGYILLACIVLISFTPHVGSNRTITWMHMIGFFIICILWIVHGSFQQPGPWIFLVSLGILVYALEQISRRVSFVHIPVVSVIQYTPQLFSIEFPVTPQLGDVLLISPNFYEMCRSFFILPSGHVIMHAKDPWTRQIRDRLYSQDYQFIKEKWFWSQGPYHRPLVHLPKEKNQRLVLVGGGTSLVQAILYIHALLTQSDLQGSLTIFASFKTIQNASWFLDRIDSHAHHSQIQIHICFTHMITVLPSDLKNNLFQKISIICGSRWVLTECFKEIAKRNVKDRVVYASLYKAMDKSVEKAVQEIHRLHRDPPKFAALSF